MTPVTRFLMTLLLALTVGPAFAEDGYKPDDQVSLDLSTEGWATTTTARVVVHVDAAGSNSGSMHEDMQKAVAALVKADWRLIVFSRSEDQTGLERWNASFEARIPESQLGGIHESAKKLSKAGMQLTVGEIAFDPTLAEIEAVKAKLRADLYKQIGEQLAALNAAFPGRPYRVSTITFSNTGFVPPMPPRPHPMMRAMVAMAPGSSAGGMATSEDDSMERGQKITLDAQVVFAAVAPTATK